MQEKPIPISPLLSIPRMISAILRTCLMVFVPLFKSLFPAYITTVSGFFPKNWFNNVYNIFCCSIGLKSEIDKVFIFG